MPLANLSPLLLFLFIVAVFCPDPWSKFSFPISFFLEVTPQTSCGVSLQRLRLHGSLLFKWLKWLPTISGSEFKPLAM